jgi:NAD(P)H-dependent FMN reductase
MTESLPRPLNLLVLSGSGRTKSLNTRLADLAVEAAVTFGATTTQHTVGDFPCPGYDGDDETLTGLPAGAVALGEALNRADAFVIACPEYNASVPGTVKNLIDWISRLRPHPWHGKHGLIMSASPSMVGGNRGLWALRVPLEHLGAHIYPDMFSLADAGNQLSEDGRITEHALADRFTSTVTGFLELVEAAKNYPCARNAWIEFLGEADPGRVQVPA